MRAAAYNNPNRPGTHLPRKMAPHRPSFLVQFLIHNPELETGLTCTKQTADLVSNRQFFAFLKSPDTWAGGPGSQPLTFRVPHARFVSVGLFSEPSRRSQQAKDTGKLPKTLRKRPSLIGNDMHSPENVTALQCATYIFLIGNEVTLFKDYGLRAWQFLTGTNSRGNCRGAGGELIKLPLLPPATNRLMRIAQFTLSASGDQERRSRTLSLRTLPSTVLPSRRARAALITAPICLSESASVSATASSMAREISASVGAAGK
jgi:hypothetical protein